MNRSNRPALLQRGAFAFLSRSRLDGPIARELRTGLTRVAAELRRTAALVSIRRRLHRIDVEEKRAIREVNYLREELIQNERNLSWLEIEYRLARERLNDRLNTIQQETP